MKTKRILICIMVLALMVSLFAACGHKHEYAKLGLHLTTKFWAQKVVG